MEQDLDNASAYFPRDFDPEWFTVPAGAANPYMPINIHGLRMGMDPDIRPFVDEIEDTKQ